MSNEVRPFKLSEVNEIDRSEACVEAAARMIARYPFLATLMSRIKLVYSDAILTAATNGEYFIVSPKFIDALTLNQRIFVFGHELFHAFLNHPHRGALCKRRGHVGKYPYDQYLANIAMDLVVNDFCVQGEFGEMPPIGVHNPKLGTMHDIWEDVYERIYELAKKEGDIGKDGQYSGEGEGRWGKKPPEGEGAGGSGMSNDVVDPDNAEQITEGDIADRQQRLKADLQQARNSAKARGLMPGAIDAMIEGWLTPQIQWQEELRAELSKNYGKDDADYMASNRKAIVMPGIVLPSRKGYHLGRGVIAVDTSGSVSDAELKEFFAEMSSIVVDLEPEMTYIVMCDAAITSVDELDPKQEDPEQVMLDRSRKIGGRGGTSFSPVFDAIRKNEFEDVEWFVYLTDMCAPFPPELPGVQMIWVASTDIKAPYGRTIQIKIREKA